MTGVLLAVLLSIRTAIFLPVWGDQDIPAPAGGALPGPGTGVDAMGPGESDLNPDFQETPSGTLDSPSQEVPSHITDNDPRPCQEGCPDGVPEGGTTLPMAVPVPGTPVSEGETLVVYPATSEPVVSQTPDIGSRDSGLPGSDLDPPGQSLGTDIPDVSGAGEKTADIPSLPEIKEPLTPGTGIPDTREIQAAGPSIPDGNASFGQETIQGNPLSGRTWLPDSPATSGEGSVSLQGSIDPPGSGVTGSPVLINESSLEEGGWLHITIPGVYRLLCDITHAAPVGILIDTSSVVLNGEGHRVTPQNPSTGSNGIRVSPVQGGSPLHDIRIDNITVLNEGTALDISALAGSALDYITVSGTGTGLALRDSHDILVRDFSASGNGNGVCLTRTKGMNLEDLVLSGTGTGIRIDSAQNDTMSRVTVNGSRGTGITISNSNRERVASTTITGGNVGVLIQNSNGCSVENSLIDHTSLFGVSLGAGRGNTLSGTIIRSYPGSTGIRLRGNNNGVIIDSCEVSGGAYGILVDRSSALLVNTTQVSGVSAEGLSMRESELPVITGLHITDTGTGMSFVTLHSLLVSGSSVKNSSEGIAAQDLHDSVIRDTLIDGCRGNAVSVTASPGLLLDDNRIRNSGTGILVRNAQVNISSNEITGSGSGIVMNASRDSVLLSNRLQGGTTGITIYNGNSSQVLGNTLEDAALYGISVQYSPGLVLSGNRFGNRNNTWIPGSSGDGIIWNTTRSVPGAGTRFNGGNTWVSPEGRGFSTECTDLDRDGFCDTPYPVPGSGEDLLPVALATPKPLVPPLPPGPGPDFGDAGWRPGTSGPGVPARDLDAVCTGYSLNEDLLPGTISTGTFTFRNTGRFPWPATVLALARFEGTGEMNRLYPEPPSDRVQPGSACSFSGTLALPATDKPRVLVVTLCDDTPEGTPVPFGTPFTVAIREPAKSHRLYAAPVITAGGRDRSSQDDVPLRYPTGPMTVEPRAVIPRASGAGTTRSPVF